MFENRKRRRGYKFTEKTHSKRGIIATVLALMLLILYGVMTYWSYRAVGTLSMYYGSAGLVALLVSLVGLFIAIRSLWEEDSFQLFPRLGLLFSLMSVGCWAGTYALGFMS